MHRSTHIIGLTCCASAVFVLLYLAGAARVVVGVTYIVIQPWDLDGVKQPTWSQAIEADSFEEAQAEGHRLFTEHVREVLAHA